MLKRLYILCLIYCLTGCFPKGNNDPHQPTSTNQQESTTSLIRPEKGMEPADSLQTDAEADYAWYHIVIVDTSDHYDKLMNELRIIETRNGLKVDLMGRYFDKKKQAIILPENDEDELYAGSYFPRRYPGNTLSIEYLKAFTSNTAEKTMALVANISEKRNEADSLANALKPDHAHTHIITSKVFIGCLH